jgi:hypothetical protein
MRNRRRAKTSIRPMCRPTRRPKARASRPAARSRKRPDASVPTLNCRQIIHAASALSRLVRVNLPCLAAFLDQHPTIASEVTESSRQAPKRSWAAKPMTTTNQPAAGFFRESVLIAPYTLLVCCLRAIPRGTLAALALSSILARPRCTGHSHLANATPSALPSTLCPIDPPGSLARWSGPASRAVAVAPAQAGSPPSRPAGGNLDPPTYYCHRR